MVHNSGAIVGGRTSRTGTRTAVARILRIETLLSAVCRRLMAYEGGLRSGGVQREARRVRRRLGIDAGAFVGPELHHEDRPEALAQRREDVEKQHPRVLAVADQLQVGGFGVDQLRRARVLAGGGRAVHAQERHRVIEGEPSDAVDDDAHAFSSRQPVPDDAGVSAGGCLDHGILSCAARERRHDLGERCADRAVTILVEDAPTWRLDADPIAGRDIQGDLSGDDDVVVDVATRQPRAPPAPPERGPAAALGQHRDAHRGVERDLAHHPVAARLPPESPRPPPDGKSRSRRTGKRASRTSGSVIRVLVLWVCTADAPGASAVAPAPPAMVS